MSVSHIFSSQGICFEPVESSDLPAWLESKKACYRAYVDQYYGGWVDDAQIHLNTKSFTDARGMSFFRKITINGETAGFLSYNETRDLIERVTIHMFEFARNRGIGSHFLNELTIRSETTGKPIFLKVFKNNPAQALYRRFGFHTYVETSSHLLMKFTPNNTV